MVAHVMGDLPQEGAGTGCEGARGVDGDQAGHHPVAVEHGQQAGSGGVGAAGPQLGQRDVGGGVDGAARLDAQVALLGPEPGQQRHRWRRTVAGEQRRGGRPALLHRGDPLSTSDIPGAEAQVRPARDDARGDDAVGEPDAQARVAQHTVADVQPGAGQPAGVRPLPGGDEYEVGDEVLAVVEGQPPPVAPPLHLGDPPAQPGFDAAALVRRRHESTSPSYSKTSPSSVKTRRANGSSTAARPPSRRSIGASGAGSRTSPGFWCPDSTPFEQAGRSYGASSPSTVRSPVNSRRRSSSAAAMPAGPVPTTTMRSRHPYLIGPTPSPWSSLRG